MRKSGMSGLILAMFVVVCYGGVTYTSFNNKSGAWEVAGTWNSSKPSNTTLTSDDVINIYGYVTRNGSYTINGNGTLHIYDTLVITGNLTMSQLSPTTGVQIHNGGVLIVLGDFSTGNSGGNMVNVQAGGKFVVIGNYNQQQGSVTTTGAFYVFDDTPTFNWGSTVDGTGYSNNTSTLTGLLDDESDLFNNDKALGDFLETLGVSPVVCNLAPNYITKTGAGTWTTANSWNGNTKPPYTLSGGAYTIPANEIVTIESGNFTLSSANLIVYGTLIVNGTLNMDATKLIDIKSGGRVTCCQNCNSSNKIKVGGSTVWTGNNGTVNGPATISSGGIVLPIELIYFKIESVMNNGVSIQWATSLEKDFDYFLLERADVNLMFQPIASIKGIGASEIKTVYHHLDQSPINGKNYYRLRSVDQDGAYELSNLIVAEWNVKSDQIQIYPNPTVNRSFTIRLDDVLNSPVTISLVDLRGISRYQMIMESTSSTITLPDDVKSGVYILKCTGTQGTRSVRLIVQ